MQHVGNSVGGDCERAMANEAWGVCSHTTIKRATGNTTANSINVECSGRLCRGVYDGQQPVFVMEIRQMHLETRSRVKTEKTSRSVAALSRAPTFVQTKGVHSNSKHDDTYNTGLFTTDQAATSDCGPLEGPPPLRFP